jgi:hypothetical protein
VPDIDVVRVATPVPEHRELVLAALAGARRVHSRNRASTLSNTRSGAAQHTRNRNGAPTVAVNGPVAVGIELRRYFT